MTPEFADANQLRMEREVLEEVQGYLCWMDLLTSSPLYSLEPGREALPQNTIKKAIEGPPSTPVKLKGCSYSFTVVDGTTVCYEGKDVRLKDIPPGSQAQDTS